VHVQNQKVRGKLRETKVSWTAGGIMTEPQRKNRPRRLSFDLECEKFNVDQVSAAL
jgi:hypothetical protein